MQTLSYDKCLYKHICLRLITLKFFQLSTLKMYLNLLELMHLAFTHMLGERYHGQSEALLLCSREVFRALIDSSFLIFKVPNSAERRGIGIYSILSPHTHSNSHSRNMTKLGKGVWVCGGGGGGGITYPGACVAVARQQNDYLPLWMKCTWEIWPYLWGVFVVSLPWSLWGTACCCEAAERLGLPLWMNCTAALCEAWHAHLPQPAVTDPWLTAPPLGDSLSELLCPGWSGQSEWRRMAEPLQHHRNIYFTIFP